MYFGWLIVTLSPTINYTEMNESQKKQTNKVIGKNIRTFRHQRGWSQEDVASRLGISIPAFSKIETGVTDINLSRLEQIANIYELDVVQIIAMDTEVVEQQPTNLSIMQKRLLDRETEIVNLQRKVILLYEELRNAKVAVNL
jgi:transcriptional regulator with XRE-family HTH domain